MRITFKVHKAEPRNFVDGVAREQRVTLHPIDPHEPGENELTKVSRSGEGKLVLRVDEPAALGRFQVGRLVALTLEFL